MVIAAAAMAASVAAVGEFPMEQFQPKNIVVVGDAAAVGNVDVLITFQFLPNVRHLLLPDGIA